MAENRPHYHVWVRAGTGLAMFMRRKGFNSTQAAAQWAKRQGIDRERFQVIRCHLSAHECRHRPPLD